MKCSNCGNEIRDGIKFCAECGAKVEVPVNRETIFCTECGYENDKNTEICYGCGNSLKQKPVSPSTAALTSNPNQQTQFQSYNMQSSGSIFENCGLYLKKFAKLFGWIAAIGIPVILFLFTLSVNDALSNYFRSDPISAGGIVLALIFSAIIGVFILIFFMKIYAVGKIIDDLSEIKKTICDKDTLDKILKVANEVKNDNVNSQNKKK